ncbi:phage virion morphogenesis protein [Pseudarcicella hirudinis]
MLKDVPAIISETATEYFKESFVTKSFDGKAWTPAKRNEKRGSLMVRTGALMGSIRPSLVSASKVTISAGSTKVPYAKVHNEGGEVILPPRSETFIRNRNKKGRFKKGTVSGQGFTLKESRFNMPKRQFMGHTQKLNNIIVQRIQSLLKEK